MGLIEEIEENRKHIHTDAYPMSIGEIVNLYNDKELDIHPEFQRIYRWSDEQKTKLIESILLGIPLPSVFVAQREDGVWDVIDGLQRLSTIFSFMGILRDENDNVLPQLVLNKTEYLPSLENTVWDTTISTTTDIVYNELIMDLKRVFKREKIEFKIIKKESDENTKYELFQRLNTGGSSLSDQEVRNCLLIMLNHDCYDWLKNLADYTNFRESIPLTEKAISEEGYMELALRFFIYRKTDGDLRNHTDLNEYITSYMQKLFISDFDYAAEADLFKKVFDLFNEALGENSFKRFSNGKYSGAFVTSVFEVLAIGLSFNNQLLINRTSAISKIKQISEELYENVIFKENMKHGTRATKRFINLINLGKDLF